MAHHTVTKTHKPKTSEKQSVAAAQGLTAEKPLKMIFAEYFLLQAPRSAGI
jgi:hypothetical protein